MLGNIMSIMMFGLGLFHAIFYDKMQGLALMTTMIIMWIIFGLWNKYENKEFFWDFKQSYYAIFGGRA